MFLVVEIQNVLRCGVEVPGDDVWYVAVLFSLNTRKQAICAAVRHCLEQG